MASPELFPAETFYQQTQCVKVVHRSCGRLTGANAAVMVGDLLDAATAGQQLVLPDPPSARRRLHQLLTSNHPNYLNDLPTGINAGSDATMDPVPGSEASEGSMSHSRTVGRTGARSRVAAAVTSVTSATCTLDSVRSLINTCTSKRNGRARVGCSRGRCSRGRCSRGSRVATTSAAVVGSSASPLLTAYQVAGRVVAFTELFFSQLRMQQLRARLRAANWAPVSADAVVETATPCLGFALMGVQRRVLGEVLRDMAPGSAGTMYRLLQGDVGSGKTAVAMLAMLAAVACGYQGVAMARELAGGGAAGHGGCCCLSVPRANCNPFCRVVAGARVLAGVYYEVEATLFAVPCSTGAAGGPHNGAGCPAPRPAVCPRCSPAP